MHTANKNIFTSLYKSSHSTIICSLKLSHRTQNMQIVEINSPFLLIRPSIVKINTASTSHNFVIHFISNKSGIDSKVTLADGVNSIALCILQSKLPFSVVVGAAINENILLYDPVTYTVEYAYFEDLKDKSILSTLRQQCIDTYNQMISTL